MLFLFKYKKPTSILNLRANFVFFFFFNDTATTEIYTLSLHDALPICIPQRQQDAIGVERLFEKVVGAQLGRLDGGLDRAMTRDHHDLRLRIELAETLKRLEAIHAFHFDVEKHEMRLEFGVDSRGFMAGSAGLDFDLLVLEDLRQGLTNALLIVDDQHAAGTQRVALRRRYKTTPVG